MKTFEFGAKDRLLSNYLRALVYVRLQRLEDAAAEFNAILTHRGLGPLSPISGASELGLARVSALQGDLAKSHAAYESLISGWRNADPDLPILKKAKAEYAKLH